QADKDWLLDIKLYSGSFYADRVSIIFNELGLHQQSLREHLSTRERFLGAKARLTALKRWVQPDFTATDLDLAMIAVVVRAENCDLPHILFALAEEVAEADLGLEANPVSVDELIKYDLVAALLAGFHSEVGYPATVEELNGEAPFKFGHFLIRLLTTGFCESFGAVPDWASDLAITSTTANATAR
ncbi:MAG: BREX-1 system phosphatase PglZ type A, partial [Planctomycetaceae bacterium]|nr:BREX-1 system phosphatase PglZ type A [Planctomycetaceae bacterium]